MGDTSSDATGTYAPANWIALSDSAGAEDAAHTTLTGELTGGTLARVHASYAHTNGTASYTLIASFTSDRVANAYKYGTFNAASGGTLCFEKAFAEVVPLKVGDTIQVVDTVTL
jgi:hypothetical protein